MIYTVISCNAETVFFWGGGGGGGGEELNPLGKKLPSANPSR